MRLLFNILWIDDQPDYVSKYSFEIEPAVNEEGFSLNVIKVRSLDEALTYISEHGTILDNIDLVLIDYNLGLAVTGDIAAREIRKKVRFKDIVFYSAEPVSELQAKIYAQRVEGVYCTDRDGLATTVRGLFRDIVRKVVDLEHVRGIVMGATSDYEQIVVEAITALDKVLSAEHREQLVCQAVAALERAGADLAEILSDLQKRKSFARLVKKFQFTAFHRIELTESILNLLFDGAEVELSNSLGIYRTVTMPKRNKLGHTRIRVTGSLTDFSKGGKEYSVEELKDLQRDLVNHAADFKKLATLAGIGD
jgi:hypothetical protein